MGGSLGFMNTKRFIPFAAIAAGVVGAVLRGLNLHAGYEASSLLPIPGNRPQQFLIALSIVAVLGMFIWSRAFRAARGASFEDAFLCPHTGYKMLAVLCGGVIGVSGIVGLVSIVMDGLPSSDALPVGQRLIDLLPLVPLWILAVLTMVSFIVTASAQSKTMTERRAIFTIIPMFWACFDLIITFKDNSASPFVSLYVFELFAAIALVFAFYTMAGFLYSTSNPARFVFTSAISIFFCFTCVGGYLVCWLLGGGPVVLSSETKLRYLCFAAASIYLLANLIIVTHSLDGDKPLG